MPRDCGAEGKQMKNGHARSRPANPSLKAAGYCIRSAPSRHDGHVLYWWERGDESGDDQWSKSAAEAEALEHHSGAPAPYAGKVVATLALAAALSACGGGQATADDIREADIAVAEAQAAAASDATRSTIPHIECAPGCLK